jgi:hypothetical protein
LFLVFCARGALQAAVDLATDGNPVADLETADITADGGHMADDLVTGHDGIDRVVPVVVHLMGIGMADTAIGDIDGDVIVTQGPTLETKRREGGVGLMGGKSQASSHG